MKRFDDTAISFFFQMMDENNDGKIDTLEFFNLCEVLLWTIQGDESPWARICPCILKRYYYLFIVVSVSIYHVHSDKH
jgi:hypothetical protein